MSEYQSATTLTKFNDLMNVAFSVPNDIQSVIFSELANEYQSLTCALPTLTEYQSFTSLSALYKGGIFSSIVYP